MPGTVKMLYWKSRDLSRASEGLSVACLPPPHNFGVPGLIQSLSEKTGDSNLKIWCHSRCHRSWCPGKGWKTESATPPESKAGGGEQQQPSVHGQQASQRRGTSGPCSTEQGPALPNWELSGLQGAEEAPCQAGSQPVPQSKPSPSPTTSMAHRYLQKQSLLIIPH